MQCYYLNHGNFLLYSLSFLDSFRRKMKSNFVPKEFVILTKNALEGRRKACGMSEDNRSNHKTLLLLNLFLRNYLICSFISHYSLMCQVHRTYIPFYLKWRDFQCETLFDISVNGGKCDTFITMLFVVR